jgi:hypothetical protein
LLEDEGITRILLKAPFEKGQVKAIVIDIVVYTFESIQDFSIPRKQTTYFEIYFSGFSPSVLPF